MTGSYMKERKLPVGDDAWCARLLGAGAKRLEITLNGRSVGPLVQWEYESPVFQGSLAPRRTHCEKPREGVIVRWRLKGNEATVAIDYEGHGRIGWIRASSGVLRKWEHGRGLEGARRSRST